MRITENALRRIIREVISEDLNEGIFGDFIDTFGQEDYKKYKMILQLCEKLFQNILEDERFHDIDLYLDDKSMKNVISGDLIIKASADKYERYVATNPGYSNNRIRNMRYAYNVTSEISKDISNLMLKFNNKHGGYENFVVNVPLVRGKNRFLNRPDFETEEVINIGDRIHAAFLSAMDKR